MSIYYVDYTLGDDANAGGAYGAGTAFKTFKKATDTAIADDEIHVLNTSSEVATVSQIFTIADGVRALSTNTSDVYTVGASVAVGSSGDMTFTNNDKVFESSGIEFLCEDDMALQSVGSKQAFYNTTIGTTVNGTGHLIQTRNNGVELLWKDCTLTFANAGNYIYIGGGASFFIDNLSYSGTKITSLFSHGGNGPCNANIKNTDLDAIMTTNLLAGFVINNDGFYAKLEKCKLPSGFVSIGGTITGKNYSVELISCDNGSGYHYFEKLSYQGVSSEDTTNYLSATYDDTNGFSALMESSSDANIGNPLIHKLIELPAQNLTSNTTYTINFESNTQLYEGDFWLSLSRPDGTSQALGIIQSGRNADILASGSEHTTNTEAWNVVKTYRYEAGLTVTGMAGVDNGAVTINTNLALPNVDVWIDPAVVIS